MKKKFTLLTCLLTISFSFCFAQSGTLDSSFGSNGIAKLEHGDSLYTSAITIQPDNTILAGSGYKAYIARLFSPYHLIPIIQKYKSDGAIDRLFGINGETYLPYSISDEVPDFTKVDAINVLPNKKILVTETNTFIIGNNYDEYRQYYLCRLNNNGVIDSSFGTNGYVVDQFSYDAHEVPLDIWNIHSAIQPGAKIIVAVNGIFHNASSDTTVGLKRYKANGELDSSFGTNGIVFYGIDKTTTFQLQQVIALPGGKILITGTSENIHFSEGTGAPDTATNFNFVMARFLNNGTIDGSFGVNGLVKTPFPDLIYEASYNSQYGYEYTYPSALAAIQTNGDIILSGTTFHNNHYSFTSVGYHPNGSINHNFGNNGFQYRQSTINANNTYVAATDTISNNILVGGTTGLPVEKIAIVKYLPDGSIDNSFGKHGTIVTSIYNSTTRLMDMQAQGDGRKIVAAAIINFNPEFDSSYNGTCYLIKYNNSNPVAPTANSSAAIAATPITRLLLSPNPAKGSIMIQGLSAAAKTITLADLNGRIIQQVNVTGTNYSFQIQALPAGMYFISVNDNNKTITLRFIKE